MDIRELLISRSLSIPNTKQRLIRIGIGIVAKNRANIGHGMSMMEVILPLKSSVILSLICIAKRVLYAINQSR